MIDPWQQYLWEARLLLAELWLKMSELQRHVLNLTLVSFQSKIELYPLLDHLFSWFCFLFAQSILIFGTSLVAKREKITLLLM